MLPGEATSRISVHRETLDALIRLKVHDRETHEDVIRRLIYLFQTSEVVIPR